MNYDDPYMQSLEGHSGDDASKRELAGLRRIREAARDLLLTLDSYDLRSTEDAIAALERAIRQLDAP